MFNWKRKGCNRQELAAVLQGNDKEARIARSQLEADRDEWIEQHQDANSGKRRHHR
jgi:hypothetical protein